MHELLHLTSINPYIASTLPSGAKSGAASAKGLWASLPKQPGPDASLSAAAGNRNVGISAFAFQGTNAHVVLLG